MFGKRIFDILIVLMFVVMTCTIIYAAETTADSPTNASEGIAISHDHFKSVIGPENHSNIHETYQFGPIELSL